MKVGIIGAGFTGLSSAYQLAKKGHEVTIFEMDSHPGGLALGFQQKNWEWSLEKHYHHWFTNDSSVLNLAKEINYPVIIKRPKTSVYIDKFIYQLDSPLHVLKFPKLKLLDRIRMAGVLALLRYNPIWQPLEKINAVDFLSKTMGKKAYEKLWEPQLTNKFGKYINEISLAWFWARVKKRTSNLAYPEFGFLHFAEKLVREIEKRGGKFLFNTQVLQIQEGAETLVKTKNHTHKFDKIIVTLPSFFFLKIAPQLPDTYKNSLSKLKGLGAINLVLRLKNKFLTDGTYWLSVCDKKSPIMAIVEHTNFIDKKNYDNEHIVYLGNYLPHDHPYFKTTPEELLKIFHPFLKTINSNYKSSLIDYHVFKAPFAQPIIPLNYSKIIPKFETPLQNIYLANIQQVYPWDRGTNYAVELGEKITNILV